MPTDTLTAACIGKLPTHGDFVRHRATTPAMRAFDAWVQKGLYQARQDRRALDATYDEAPAYRFIFRSPEAREQLMGVTQPSRDQAGRMYPFTVALEAEADAFGPRQLPYALGHASGFYDAAARLVATATAGDLTHHEATDHVEALQPTLEVTTAPSQAYKRYLRQQTTQSLFAQLFGHFGDGRKYRLFKNILDITLPLQGRRSVRLSYGLKFPLGTEADVLDVRAAFWIELVLRLLDYPNVAPSVFWTSPSRAEVPDASALFLFLDTPRPDAFTHLVRPGLEDDYICDLVQMGGQTAAEAALAIPDAYGRLLEQERLTLWDFLREL